MPTVLKTVVPQGTVGSNPTPSANNNASMTKFCIHANAGISLVSARGKLQPCCKYNARDTIDSIYTVTTLNGLHDTAQYKQMQAQLNAGEFPRGCGYCKTTEDSGRQSRRQHTNQMYEDLNIYVPGHVQDLEIALDYTCNMMCRMCNPGASSKWNIAQSVITQFAERDIDLDVNNQYRSYQDQLRSVLDNTDLSHARIIKIEGGEPFYAKNLEWFLDKLDQEVIDKNNLYLDIFTNGSIFPSVKILDKLAKLNAVIVFSIDAVGELASTIRWGVDWDRIANNMGKWRRFADANTSMSLQTNITVSLLNVNRLAPLLAFCNELNIDINFSELTFPHYLSIYQLPKSVRQRWTYDDKTLTNMIMADIAIEPEFAKFISSVNILDAYQGYSFETVNSEMYQLIQSLFPCCEA